MLSVENEIANVDFRTSKDCCRLLATILCSGGPEARLFPATIHCLEQDACATFLSAFFPAPGLFLPEFLLHELQCPRPVAKFPLQLEVLDFLQDF